MRRLLLATMSVTFLSLPACQRDPGRDVEPLGDPLRTEASRPTTPLEIIPLEKVRKSPSARQRGVIKDVA